MSGLARLKNLGPKSTAWLTAIGVDDRRALEALGAIGAYRALKAHGYPVTVLLVYAIEGALRGVHWHDLPPDLKAELARAAREAI